MEILKEYFIPILPTPALRINTSGGTGTGVWVLKCTDEYLKEYDKKRLMTGKQGYTYRKKKQIEKYYAFKDELAFWFKKNKIEPPYKNFSIQFRLPIGDSIRPKIAESRVGKDHEQRPDVDNMNKAYLDSFNKRKTMMWFDYKDCITNRIFISKVWCRQGEEGIRIREYDYLDL
jgi:Holliday junction resolvase RusA-like endonuclease